MALATRCPHCQTAFRVASDQLKLRAGLVRCGTCKQIFNGIENLLRPDEDIPAALAGPARPLPPVPLLEAQDKSSPPPRAENTRSDDLIADVDSPHQLQDAGPVPLAGTSDALWAALDEDPPLPEPPVDAAPDTNEPAKADDGDGSSAATAADEATAATVAANYTGPDNVANNSGHDQLEEPADALSDSAPDSPFDDRFDQTVENASVLPGLLRAARIDPDEDVTLPMRTPPRLAPVLPEPPSEVPDFLARERQEQGAQRVPRPVLWCIGALLALLLAGQLVYAARTPIAANFPHTRATLDAACRMLGCQIGLPMQIESVSIESSEFQPVPNRRDQFMLGVVLRNRSTTVEAWPAIELSLNDASDRTVGRRVILPREYLPPGLATARGFSAGSEQPLKVYFDLARLPASGYRVYLFYP